MHFVKMHGLGNDYVYMDGFSTALPAGDAALKRLAVAVSDRHRGIGSDGLILILPSSVADIRMRMFNSDGSESEMCGNGIRCVGRYALTRGLISRSDPSVETGAGIRRLEIAENADRITVDMGEPDFEPSTIPVVAQGNGNVNIPATLSSGKEVKITAVSMGNPHGVVFVDNLAEADVHGTGAELETHAMWPDRANIEFAEVKSPSEIVMRVWERGSGETMACGTGACATAVAAALTGRASREVTIKLLGGNLQIRWDDATNHVFMTGSATLVFTGEVQL